MITRIKIIVSRILAYVILPSIILLKYLSDFNNTSIVVSKVPFLTGIYLRYFFYKIFLQNVGKNVTISYGTIFTNSNIEIGNNVRFGPYNTVADVSFGNDITTAQYVHFLSGNNQHGTKLNGVPMTNQIGMLKHIKIGNDIWVGANCSIMNNIKDGCVIGTGSVLIKETNENGIYAGVPAKLVRMRN